MNIPPKLYPFIFDFNNYTYFLLEGGRASGKTQSVARFLLYIMENRHVRICCGREIQNSIDDILSLEEKIIELNEPYKGVYLPKMVWKEMYDFSADSVLLCISSQLYNPEEYIRSFEDYCIEMESR